MTERRSDEQDAVGQRRGTREAAGVRGEDSRLAVLHDESLEIPRGGACHAANCRRPIATRPAGNRVSAE